MRHLGQERHVPPDTSERASLARTTARLTPACPSRQTLKSLAGSPHTSRAKTSLKHAGGPGGPPLLGHRLIVEGWRSELYLRILGLSRATEKVPEVALKLLKNEPEREHAPNGLVRQIPCGAGPSDAVQSRLIGCNGLDHRIQARRRSAGLER